MSDIERPHQSENPASIPPDTKKEGEVFDKFDFGSAQMQSSHHSQQDYCTIAFPLAGADYLVALVADGASWAEHAAEASSLAGMNFTETIQQRAERDEEINPAVVKMILQEVNDKLLEKSHAGEREAIEIADAAGLKGEARELAICHAIDRPTTFEGMVFIKSKIITAHLGDSRIYRLRGGVLSQLTRDQTRAEQLRSQGLPTKKIDEHILTNHLGKNKPDISVDEFSAEKGDVWLAVSDEVFKVLAKKEISDILSQPKDAISLANDLIAAVKKRTASSEYFDDASAVVVKVK